MFKTSETILFIATLIGIVAAIIIGVNALSRAQCLHSYDRYAPQYSIMSGCRIMHNGILTPTDIVREVQ